MARASVPTLLPLDTFAKIMGINPVHFNGAIAPPIWTTQGQCRMIWSQSSWQAEDVTSREELAQAIHDAEKDITTILGYPIGPTWFSDEVVTTVTPLSKIYRPGSTFKLRYGEVIAGGRRATTLIDDDLSVTYSDQDNDGFPETATLTLTVPDEITDPQEIRVYYNDHGANPVWEIRPALSRSLSNHIATLTFKSWLFIIPDYFDAPAGEYEYDAIDLSQIDNLVTSVTVYRVWNDTTQPASAAYRGGGYCGLCNGSGCAVCTTYSQEGCLIVIDPHIGIVQPQPASYSSDLHTWQFSSPSYQLPFSMHFWYYAGAQSDEFLQGYSDIPISNYLAQSISYLAAARLDKPFCQCGNVEKTLKEMRRDLSLSGNDSDAVRIPFDSIVYKNPFGSRVGEVKAWHRVNSLIGNAIWGAAIL